MTTVTESAKWVLSDDDENEAFASGDLSRICADPALAQRFARKLASIAREAMPGREWTPEDLRDLLEVAVHGTPQRSARILEGRYFRKRLREQINLADRYGDTFAVVVLTMVEGVSQEVYSSVLDAVTDRLRNTDMVFLYRRRFALVLPRLREATLGPLLERVEALVAVGAGREALDGITSLVYPEGKVEDGSEVLDWAEDQLR